MFGDSEPFVLREDLKAIEVDDQCLSIDLTNDKDWGVNPCVEVSLRAFQFCNLCEVNVSDIISQED